MKKKNLFVLFSFPLLCVACGLSDVGFSSQGKDEIDISKTALIDDAYYSNEIAQAIALKYIQVEDGLYVLNLSSKEAEALKISPSDYCQFQEDIEETNMALTQAQLKATSKPINKALGVLYTDQTLNIINPKPFKAAGEAGGVFTLTGNEMEFKSVFVPEQCKTLTVYVYSSSIIGLCNVIVRQGGQVITGDWSVSTVASYGCCKFTLPLSNVWIEIGVKVSSSGGGNWSYVFG